MIARLPGGPREAGQWPHSRHHTANLPLVWRSFILHGEQSRIPAPVLPGA